MSATRLGQGCRAAIAVAAMTIVATLGVAGSASADPSELPTPGTITQCTFSPRPAPARTHCRTETVTVSGPVCLSDGDQPYLLYEVDHYASATDYAGNVVAGVAVDGYYTQVRPHAVVVYYSGVHAYAVHYMFYVESC
jgi:hypothetical protein